MIPAPFLAGCPAAIDRLRWFVLSRGGADLLPWPLPLPGVLLACLPALVVSALALWIWHARRVNLAAVLFVFAAAVHPPLTLALMPLFAWVAEARPSRRTSLLHVTAVLAATSAILWWGTPSCNAPPRATMLALLAASLPALSAGIGAIVGALALFETLRNPRAPLTRVTWLVVLASALGVWIFQSFHAVATLTPAFVLIWWLAAHGAVALVRRQSATVARFGALVLIMLIPVLQVVPVARSLPAQSPAGPQSAQAIVDALNQMWSPAAIVAEDTAHSFLTTIWRASERRQASTLQVLDPHSHQADDMLSTRAVYAFERGARRLAQRGVWMGPMEPPAPLTRPLLWRAYASQGCVRLTPEWRDVTSLALGGQISAVFSKGGTPRRAIVYAVVGADAAISPTPIGWPPDAAAGYRAVMFDASNPANRASAVETMQADGFPMAMIPERARFLARLSIERLERTPGALAVAFDATPDKLFARLDGDGRTHLLELCRSSQDLTVVGHREAPRRAAIDLSSPAVTGRGWHASEREGETHFRWTAAPVAEIRFIAVRPAPLTLSFQILDRAVRGTGEELSVSLNGVAAMCESNGADCAWVLPIEAMRAGWNVVTLRAPLLRGSHADPRPDPRPLGLKIGSVELHHRGATGRDFAVPGR
jgi:hypothetical protein